MIEQADRDAAALEAARPTAGFPERNSTSEGGLGAARLGRGRDGDGQQRLANDSFSVQDLRAMPREEHEDDDLSQRDRLQLSHSFINQ